MIQELKEKQIDTVITGNPTPEIAALLKEAGIDLYHCSGALTLNPNLTHDCAAQNTASEPTQWFRSGCPNDPDLANFHFDRAAEKAASVPGLKGVMLDGARFASFASAEGKEAFFTCFCPRCMEKMTRLGYDARAIRAMAAHLKEHRQLKSGDEAAFLDWLSFREQCAEDLFALFAQKIRKVNPDLLVGAFVFAPSLGRFVGQTPKAYAMLDVILPMLYRDYPHPDGPACLGHEWAAFYELFGENAPKLLDCAGIDPSLIPQTKDPKALLDAGFAPERIGTEVAVARKTIPQTLWPILQIEDAKAAESARHALANGADGVGYFAYGRDQIPALSHICSHNGKETCDYEN